MMLPSYAFLKKTLNNHSSLHNFHNKLFCNKNTVN